jgi:hypothetical protein
MDLDGDFLEKEIVAFNFTDFRGEDFFKKSTNQKQGSPVVTMFVNGSN